MLGIVNIKPVPSYTIKLLYVFGFTKTYSSFFFIFSSHDKSIDQDNSIYNEQADRRTPEDISDILTA